MHIFETCCCGATFTGQGFTVERYRVIDQAAEFRKAHKICRDRPKINIGTVKAGGADELIQALHKHERAFREPDDGSA